MTIDKDESFDVDVETKKQQQNKRPATDETDMTSTSSEVNSHKRPRQTPRSSNKKLLKYWVQRYSLFSRFDDGVKLDDESWWSVTPEKIARHIALRFHNSFEDGHLVILDCFCGVGGNVIQFALQSPHIRVIGCDINEKRLSMAKHNAKIYGVKNQCEFILGDFHQIVPSLQARGIDAIFLSPPWGGVDYTKIEKYSLEEMKPNGYDIVEICRKYISNNIAFLMPRNTDIEEVRERLLTRAYPEMECEENRFGKKVKTITMYFGDLVCQDVALETNSSRSSTSSTSNVSISLTNTSGFEPKVNTIGEGPSKRDNQDNGIMTESWIW